MKVSTVTVPSAPAPLVVSEKASIFFYKKNKQFLIVHKPTFIHTNSTTEQNLEDISLNCIYDLPLTLITHLTLTWPWIDLDLTLDHVILYVADGPGD